MYMSKLVSLFVHLKNGTLLKHLSNRKQVAKHKEWERFEQNSSKFMDMPTFGGVKLRLYKDFGSSRKVFAYDAEKEEVSLVYNYLQEGDVFIDIGAHIGYFTVTSAAKVGESGQVHAFEPTPRTYEKLTENVEINAFGNVKCNNIGLSDEPGTLVLNTHPENEAYNSIGKIDKEGVVSVQIETVTLDDYAERLGLVGKIAFIKIDVEGWETFVFKGATKVLSAEEAPVMMLEFSYANQEAAGSSCRELANLLTQFGYAFYLYDSQKQKLEKFTLTDDYRSSYNLFAIKDLQKVQHRIG